MTQPSSDVAASGDSQTVDAPWPHVPLPDVVAHIVDNRGRTAPVASSGIPLIATDCIKEDTLYPVRQNLRYVSQETYETWFRGHPEPGDVILVNKGTPGRVCQVPSPVDFCIAQDMVALRPKPGVVDSDYLLAALRSSEFKEQVEGLHVGTMIPHLKKTDFHHLKVPLPPLPIQRGIGRIYCDLSRKLELNRRMNRTLEELAAALFRSWFVDFDPVVAKAAGRPPANLRPALAALFPAHFQDSPLGPIPHGWEVKPIGDVVKVVGGSTPSTNEPKFWGGDIAWATPRDLASLNDPVLMATERQITHAGLERISSGLLPKGSVLLSSRAPIGYTAITEIPVAVNQGFIALLCDGPLPNYYVLEWVRENMETIEGRANGTTFAEISKSNFRPIAALVPPPAVLDKFVETVSPWWCQIIHNVRESRTLAALRDTLLPKLLSGELRVKAAETRVGDHA